MAVDDIFIMNLALRMCKVSQSITSRTDGSAYARTLAFYYDEIKYAVLAENEWNFAVAFRQLSKTSTTPTDKDFQYEFLLPSDMLTARELMRKNSSGTIFDYEILDDNLYANEDEVVLRYMRDVDESQMPAWFRVYLASRLAELAAPVYVQDANELQYVLRLVEQHKLSAYDIDAEENPLGAGIQPSSSLIAARHLGPGSRGWFWE